MENIFPLRIPLTTMGIFMISVIYLIQYQPFSMDININYACYYRSRFCFFGFLGIYFNTFSSINSITCRNQTFSILF